MPEIPLQDIDNVRYPKRRPWLILLGILVIAGLWLWNANRPKSPEADAPLQDAAPAAVAAPAPAPAPAIPAVPAAAPAPATPESAAAPVPPSRAPATTGPAAASLVQQARAAEARSAQDSAAFAQARRLYLDALKAGVDDATRVEVETRLGALNTQIAFTPLPMPGVKIEYVVKSGDSVAKIAGKLGVTTNMIVRSNLIANPDRIRIGDRYNILTGAFAITVSKGRKDLVLTLNDEFFKRYRVSTGKYGKTPTGTFEVRDKITEPPWWRPDGKEIPYGHPENILGTRWMAIRATGNTPDVRGYGIHGTWDDNSIGKEESAGCIRMHNGEVEELYDLVPMRTPVTITD